MLRLSLRDIVYDNMEDIERGSNMVIDTLKKKRNAEEHFNKVISVVSYFRSLKTLLPKLNKLRIILVILDISSPSLEYGFL